MANRAVKLLSAILASIVLCVSVVTIPLGTTDAAEECLTTPKNETPSGQHWYYQTERGTKRHCWFLREEIEHSSRVATSTSARQAARGATRENETVVTRSTAGAHAELPMPQALSEKEVRSTTPAPMVNPDVSEQGLPDSASSESSQRSLVTSRWPEPEDMLASASTPPITPSLAAASVPEPNPGASTDRTPAAPPVLLAKAETPAMATSASLQTLILVILGALTLMGLSGSTIYRLAYARRGLQRYDSLHHEPNLQSTDHLRVQQWLEPNAENPARPAVQRVEHIRSDLEDNLRQIEKLHLISGGARSGANFLQFPSPPHS